MISHRNSEMLYFSGSFAPRTPVRMLAGPELPMQPRGPFIN